MDGLTASVESKRFKNKKGYNTMAEETCPKCGKPMAECKCEEETEA